MIFISVGTHPQAFARMLRAAAAYVETKKLREKIIVQSGYTSFTHPGMNVRPFIPIQEFESLIREARIFITHAGEGNIGTALKFGTPMIIFPRLAREGEHTNDHQLELARAVEKNKLGIVVQPGDSLTRAIMAAEKMKPIPLKGHISQTLHALCKTLGISPIKPMIKNARIPLRIPTTATIIVATLNGGEPLIRAVNGMLRQQFKGSYNIVVVDDGSFDGKTPAMLAANFGKNPRVKIISLPRSGVCKARNAGIRASTGEVVINLDHDCIPERDWLQTMVDGFDSPGVGVVSAYGHFGGTSTGFRKELLEHVGGYDEDYFYYREDTDLSFKIMELGYAFKRVSGAKYSEDRTLVKPKGIWNIAKYTLQRYKYHMNDVLLHKKHPTALCEEMLHITWGHFVNPVEDFKVATGLWENHAREMNVSSPRGMTFVQGNTITTFLFAIAVGMGYALGMKLARLAGSIKQGHLLV